MGCALAGAGGLEGGGRRAVQHGLSFGYARSGTPFMMLPQHRRGTTRWMVLSIYAAASAASSVIHIHKWLTLAKLVHAVVI